MLPLCVVVAPKGKAYCTQIQRNKKPPHGRLWTGIYAPGIQRAVSRPRIKPRARAAPTASSGLSWTHDFEASMARPGASVTRRVWSAKRSATLLAPLASLSTPSCAAEDARSTALRAGSATLSMPLWSAAPADSTPRCRGLSVPEAVPVEAVVLSMMLLSKKFRKIPLRFICVPAMTVIWLVIQRCLPTLSGGRHADCAQRDTLHVGQESVVRAARLSAHTDRKKAAWLGSLCRGCPHHRPELTSQRHPGQAPLMNALLRF
jgi:hypothetical protein